MVFVSWKTAKLWLEYITSKSNNFEDKFLKKKILNLTSFKYKKGNDNEDSKLPKLEGGKSTKKANVPVDEYIDNYLQYHKTVDHKSTKFFT